MKRIAGLAALMALGSTALAPAAAQRAITPQNRAASAEPNSATRLRCAAAFMLVLNDQQRGVKTATSYPAMEPRGRRYFEYVMGAEMLDRNLDRDAGMALAKEQIERLQKEAIEARDPAKFVDGIMQPCLRILDAKFPPE